MIVCDEPTKPDERIVLHVKMHSEDPYFPMNPVDYIHLSRLRRHVKVVQIMVITKSRILL